MTDKAKLEEIKKLADAMYYAALNLTMDASLLRKAMNEYHQFVIHKYCKEEPVSEDICNQCEAHHDKNKCDKLVFSHKCPITTESLDAASEEYTTKVLERTNMLVGNGPVGEEIDAAFRVGAQWQHKQLEKNRLAACDRQTKEEAEREMDFVMGIVDNEHRQPTFHDAIEYGAKWQKEKDEEEKVLTYKHGFDDCKEQMMSKAIDAKLLEGHLIRQEGVTHPLHAGDKVKVIVIKED